MKFKMTANITFEAASIDDAFEKLRTHFYALETGIDQLCLQLLIEPIAEETTDV